MSRQVFARITETGICNEKGRASYTIGWKGKVVAPPNRPVTALVGALLWRLNDVVGWDSVEAARADIAEAAELVQRFGEDLNAPEAPQESADG